MAGVKRECQICAWVTIPRGCTGCRFGPLSDPGEPTPERAQKPPLGIKPRHIHDELRLREVRAAIARSIQSGWKIDPAWVEEYNDLTKRRKEQDSGIVFDEVRR